MRGDAPRHRLPDTGAFGRRVGGDRVGRPCGRRVAWVVVMRFAYADPPYLGMGKLYADRHPEAMLWDDPATHQALVTRLCDEWPDGWAMSLHVPSLRVILPMCPADVRLMAWVKPFASFKPGVRVAYAWEPVIVRGGRHIPSRHNDTVRDWTAANATMRRGFPGAKPRKFCRWLFEVLNAQPGDTLDDLFPGSGAVGAAWAEYVGEKCPLPSLPLA